MMGLRTLASSGPFAHGCYKPSNTKGCRARDASVRHGNCGRILEGFHLPSTGLPAFQGSSTGLLPWAKAQEREEKGSTAHNGSKHEWKADSSATCHPKQWVSTYPSRARD